MIYRVVITGIGCVSPIGNNYLENLTSLQEGKNGIVNIPPEMNLTSNISVYAPVKNFDYSPFFSPKEAKRIPRFIGYSVAAAEEAFLSCKIKPSEIPSNAACILGVGMGDTYAFEISAFNTVQGKPISPFSLPYSIPNMASSFIAMKHKLYGCNLTISNACASSTSAIGEAFHLIRRGATKLVVTGGCEAAMSPGTIDSFASMKALSTSKDPNYASIPFDKNRTGFVIGEGAAILILEELESALNRGAPIYGEVVGYGASCDAFHITAAPEKGEGAQMAMKNALQDANLMPSEIDYINAHGSSTRLNDRSESEAILTVFQESIDKLSISSTKSATGHCLGGAGAVEAAFCVASIQNDIVPATINSSIKDDDFNLDYTFQNPTSKTINYALSNSFGFGGINACLIFKKYN